MSQITDPHPIPAGPDRTDNPNVTKSKGPAQPTETETAKKGGVEPAKRQAQRDWEDSAKESGD